MVKISFFNKSRTFTIALIGIASPISNNVFVRKGTARTKLRPAKYIHS